MSRQKAKATHSIQIRPKLKFGTNSCSKQGHKNLVEPPVCFGETGWTNNNQVEIFNTFMNIEVPTIVYIVLYIIYKKRERENHQ